MMDVLILHYHLERGGVTRIIESQIRGIHLNDSGFPVKVLCGVSSRLPKIENAVIVQDQRLNYTAESTPDQYSKSSLIELVKLIRSFINPGTIVHAHNPNLGKNPLLSAAIFQLAMEGVNILNHCHDFAEDRPMNMKVLNEALPLIMDEPVDRILYPDTPNYYFAVLNSCDYQRLSDKGIPVERIRLMPNPVDVKLNTENKAGLKKKICKKLSIPDSSLLCTYPVRPILRKNIGEFILMATLYNTRADFVITLAPLNPVEIPAYNRWKKFCRQHVPNMHFEAGVSVDFSDLVAASDFCINTSKREGFGMVYLEPWLLETPVIGRNISCVTSDLANQGIVFPRMYDEFRVPYKNSVIDFKDLPAEDQEHIIIQTAMNPEFSRVLTELNPWLNEWLDPIPDEIINSNKLVIQQKFSLNEYGHQVLGIYSEISQ